MEMLEVRRKSEKEYIKRQYLNHVEKFIDGGKVMASLYDTRLFLTFGNEHKKSLEEISIALSDEGLILSDLFDLSITKTEQTLEGYVSSHPWTENYDFYRQRMQVPFLNETPLSSSRSALSFFENWLTHFAEDEHLLTSLNISEIYLSTPSLHDRLVACDNNDALFGVKMHLEKIEKSIYNELFIELLHYKDLHLYGKALEYSEPKVK
jgi:hypothetical protein